MDSHSWEGRICLGDNPSGQRQVFWICGSLDAGVAAGTDIRSDPCAALSFQHIPRAEYCPTGSCHGAWGEISGCFTGQEGSVDPGLGWLLGGEEAALGTSRLLAWCCVCLWTPGCVPANPYNVGWVFECSRRGVSSRTVPFVDAEVMQNTEMYQRKKWGWKGPGGCWGLV